MKDEKPALVLSTNHQPAEAALGNPHEPTPCGPPSTGGVAPLKSVKLKHVRARSDSTLSIISPKRTGGSSHPLWPDIRSPRQWRLGHTGLEQSRDGDSRPLPGPGSPTTTASAVNISQLLVLAQLHLCQACTYDGGRAEQLFNLQVRPYIEKAYTEMQKLYAASPRRVAEAIDCLLSTEPGYWTQNDDVCLLSGNRSSSGQRLEDKHTKVRCHDRISFLWRYYSGSPPLKYPSARETVIDMKIWRALRTCAGGLASNTSPCSDPCPAEDLRQSAIMRDEE